MYNCTKVWYNGYMNGSNPQYVQAMQDLRRSNATQPRKARTPRKQGTRKGQKRLAISEQREA